jgi:hypothetical protein
MRDVYEVLRQKELEVSRLENEVAALRVVAPLLSEGGEAENDNQPRLPRAINDTPQPDHSGWQDRPKSAFSPKWARNPILRLDESILSDRIRIQ